MPLPDGRFGGRQDAARQSARSIPSAELNTCTLKVSITIYPIVRGFKPSPILDDIRYAGAGEGSGSAAPAAP